jgi:hypothetical protein
VNGLVVPNLSGKRIERDCLWKTRKMGEKCRGITNFCNFFVMNLVEYLNACGLRSKLIVKY